MIFLAVALVPRGMQGACERWIASMSRFFVAQKIRSLYLLCICMQVKSHLPLQSLKVVDIDDVKGEDWLSMLKWAMNLTTLDVQGSPGHAEGVLRAIADLPSLRTYSYVDDLSEGSLFKLGQIDGKLRRQGGVFKFKPKPKQR